jgi:hypothetical protein
MNIEKFKEHFKKSEKSRDADAALLDDILKKDKDFPVALYDYYISNKTYSECFKGFSDIYNCFINTEIFNFEKKSSGIEKNLFGLWKFQPNIYKNLKHQFFGDIRIEVSRKESNVTDKSIVDDLKALNIVDYKIVDIEFFEFSDWESQFDLSNKIRDSIFIINDHTELRDYIKQNKLHLEKEKIHCKFIVGKKSDKDIILPLYIGIGTNEAYGLQLKVGDDKNRWFKLTLDIEKPYIEKAYLKTKETDKNKIENLLKRYEWTGVTNDDSWDDKSVICTIINTSELDYRKEKNDALICFLKCKTKNGHPTEPIAIVSPEYNKEYVNRLDLWKEYISGQKCLNTYLFNLLEQSQNNYQCFFYMYNCPYRIISGLGTEKVARAVSLKYKKILSDGDFSLLANCVEWNNINTIAGDIHRLGIDSERNRISSLLFTYLLAQDQVNKIILNK